MAPSIKSSCEQIVDSVRDSSLHFCLNETPHSIYLTIRKRFVKPKIITIEETSTFSCETKVYAEKVENDSGLETKLQTAESFNLRMKMQLGEAVLENERICEINTAQEVQIKAYEKEIAELKLKGKAAVKNENVIQKIKEEKEILENELEASEKKWKVLHKSLKVNEKEIYDLKKENANVNENFLKVKNEFMAYKCEASKEKKDMEKKLKNLEKKAMNDNMQTGSKVEFHCEKCHVETETLNALKCHEKTYHVQNCSTQTEVVISVDRKVQTSKLESTNDKNVQITDNEFPNKVDKNFERFSCFYCDKKIQSETHLTNHIEMCSGTASSFWKQSTLPVKPAFTEEDVKSCDFCGFKFGTLGGLRNHIRSLHKEMLQAQLMLPT